jgi:hypothetical protein
MPAGLAVPVVWALTAYAAIGLGFGVAFVTAGVSRLDARAAGAGWGFRLLILPGAALFWPLLATRWLRAKAGAQ